jgi:hypothetical protein
MLLKINDIFMCLVFKFKYYELIYIYKFLLGILL